MIAIPVNRGFLHHTVPVAPARQSGETNDEYQARLAKLDNNLLDFLIRLDWTGTGGDVYGPTGSTAQASVLLPILAIDLSAPASAQGGETVSYTATLSNMGHADASGIDLAIGLPDGTVQRPQLSAAEVAPGGSIQSTVSFKIPDAQADGPVTARATVNWKDARQNGYSSLSASAVTSIGSINQPPVVNAGVDQAITLPNNAVIVNGSASDDGKPKGSALATGWSKVSGPGEVSFANANQVVTSATFSAVGTYVLRLTANDSLLTASDEVIITVNSPANGNRPPVVNAGADQSGAVCLVALSGSATDDGLPEGNTVAFSWTMLSGPGTATFANANQATTTASFSAAGTYLLRLTASDGQLAGSDDLSVTVSVPGKIDFGPSPYLSLANSPFRFDPGFAFENFEDHQLNLRGVSANTGRVTSVLFGSAIHDSVDADDGATDGSGLKGDSYISLSGSSGIKFSFDAAAIGFLPTKVGIVWTDGNGPVTFEAFDKNDVSIGVRGPFTIHDNSNNGETAEDRFFGIYFREGISAIKISNNGGSIEVDHLQYSAGLRPNAPPVVNAGPDQAVPFSNNTSTLNGTVTDDGLPVGVPPVISWSKVSGPGAVTFGNPNQAATTANFGASGTYVLRLSANDSEFTSSDDVTVNVETVSLMLTPPAAGPNVTGTQQTMTATLKGSSGTPIGGATVQFTVSGVNVASGSAVTNNQGAATFTYTGANSGKDTVQAAASLPTGPAQSNAATVDWVTPVQQISTTTVWARFFADAGSNGTFRTLPTQQPAFSQFFPTINFNPPAGTVPGNTSGVGVNTRPFTNVTTDLNGNFTGVIVAQGNGLQAGVGSLFEFSIVFSGSFVVAAAGEVTFNFFSDDGFIFGVGNGATRVRGAFVDAPASGQTAFENLPVMGAFNRATAPIANSVTVRFPSPGVYPYELDYTECCAGQLAITMTTAASGNHGVPPTGSLSLTPNVVSPKVVGQQQTFAVVVRDASGAAIPNLDAALVISGANNPLPIHSTTDATGRATFTYTGVKSGTDTAQVTAVVSGMSSYSNVVTVQWNATTNAPPVVNAGADQTVNLPNSASLSAAATDDGLPASGALSLTWSKVSGPGNVTFANPAAAATTASFSAAGSYVLRLTASDSELTAADDVVINVLAPVTGPPPAVAFAGLVDGAEVKTRTDIVGSVSGGDWKLEYALVTDDNLVNLSWVTLGAGSTAVNNGVLGTFDPTMLLNGTYAIRLISVDASGQSSSTLVTATVSGNQKVENFTLSFSDLAVPVAGLPIEIVRTYDSRDKRVGDFGVGWSLGLKDVRLEKSGVIAKNWDAAVDSGFFPRYCLSPTRPHTVTITFPDGRLYKFVAGTSPQCQTLQPIRFASITFSQVPGTTGTAGARLVPLGTPDLVADGNVPGPVTLLGDDELNVYNPTVFQLTTSEGFVYVIEQGVGVRSMTDPNGNGLNITRDGITHSSGKGVTFARDAAGRITRITDPAGSSMTYSYDADGNLVSFRDRENNETRFTYNNSHGLLTVVDPRGLQPLRNEYDAAGRLVSHTDAFGKTVTYSQDLSARREVITDRLGNAPLYEYDANGNVTRVTDALGNVTSYAYDARDNKLSETNAIGKTTSYTYDSSDNMTSVTDPAGNVTRYSYNSRRQVLTETDARGGVKTNAYDVNGNLLSTKDALGNVTSYTYGANGLTATVTDALGGLTRYEYDRSGNLTKEIDPLGSVKTYTCDANGNRLTMSVTRTLPSGASETLVTTYQYDKLHRLTKPRSRMARRVRWYTTRRATWRRK
jgi:YD repeat-containing protein